MEFSLIERGSRADRPNPGSRRCSDQSIASEAVPVRSAEFKAEVALEAIDGMSGVLSGKAEAAENARDGEVEKLRAMIGQLVVERDFLKRASERRASAGGAR